MRSVPPTTSGETRSRAADRRTGEREHGVHADGSQECALARHVRPAHDQQAQLAAEMDVVANAALPRDQRMAQSSAFEQRTIADDFRKGILRILIGIRRQRAERLEFADRGQPAGNARSGPLATTPGRRRAGFSRSAALRR